MHTKVILNDAQAPFFYQIKWETKEVLNDASKFEILVTDGSDLWKGIRVSWKDLMACRPESIEVSAHENFLKEALLGIKCDAVSGQDSLSVALQQTGTGNLSFSWKLKQSSFSITLGTIMLLKSGKEEAQSTIVSMLSDAFSSQTASQERLTQLESSLASQERLNKALLMEYEKLTKDRSQWEDEIYTKMRLLLNTKKERISQLEAGAMGEFETEDVNSNHVSNDDGFETE